MMWWCAGRLCVSVSTYGIKAFLRSDARCGEHSRPSGMDGFEYNRAKALPWQRRWTFWMMCWPLSDGKYQSILKIRGLLTWCKCGKPKILDHWWMCKNTASGLSFQLRKNRNPPKRAYLFLHFASLLPHWYIQISQAKILILQWNTIFIFWKFLSKQSIKQCKLCLQTNWNCDCNVRAFLISLISLSYLALKLDVVLLTTVHTVLRMIIFVYVLQK